MAVKPPLPAANPTPGRAFPGAVPPCLAALGCLVLAAVGGWGGGGEELADPVPLRRVILPLARIPLELEKVRLGALVPLPREEFEARAKKAAQAWENARTPPRLAQARYAAELKGNSLVGRSGTWKVDHPGATPGALPMPALNLALGAIRTQGGAEGLLGELDGKNLALWVEKSGEFFFDWSLRGTPRLDGLSFEMRVPSAATATLELILPAEFIVVAAPGTLPILGPKEAEEKSKRTWILHISGRSLVEFTLRRGTERDRSPGLILAQLQSRIQVLPGWFGADFDFQLDLLHTSARELILECDPGLEVYDISARAADVQSWEVRVPKMDSAKKGGPPLAQQLVVRFRDPIRGAVPGLKVRCLGRWSVGKVWEIPAMTLIGGVHRGESIKLILPGDVSLTRWDPGALRVASISSESDGGQILNLIPSPLSLGEKKRPSAVLEAPGLEVHVREHSRWHLSPAGQEWKAEATLTPQRGRGHHLVLRLDPKETAASKGKPSATSWQVKNLTAEPKDLVVSWKKEGPLLHVELGRGLAPPEGLRLHLTLSRPLALPASGGVVSFPLLDWFGAATRTGTLDITLDPAFQGALIHPEGLPPYADQESEDAPLFRIPIRKGPGDKDTLGKLRVLPRPGHFGVRIRQEIRMGPGPEVDQLETRAHLDLAPALEHPPVLDLFIGQPGLTWQVAGVEPGPAVHSFEPLTARNLQAGLHLLAGSHPLDVLALTRAQEPGEWRRLTFKEPLKEKVSLLLIGKGLPQDGPLPLVSIPAVGQRGTVLLDPGPNLHLSYHARGLKEGTGEKEETKAPGTLTFHHSGNHAFPVLAATFRPRAPAPLLCDQASWITYLEPGKRPLHHFRFQVWGGKGTRLPVVLPPKSTVLALRVDGKWKHNLATEGPDGAPLLHVPLAQGSRHRIEVLYHTPLADAPWQPWMEVETAPPRLPIAPLVLDRRWRLHPDLVPWNQEWFQIGTGKERFPGTRVDLADAWHAADPLLKRLRPFPTAARETRALLPILAAEMSLRPRFRPDMPLGEALALLLQESPEAVGIVVDQAALEVEGLTPFHPLRPSDADAPFGQGPFWEPLGLTLIPGREGLLLTTRRKEQKSAEVFGEDWADSFQSSLRLARLGGQDSAGTMMALVPWLYGLAPGLVEMDRAFPHLAGLEGLDQVSWREYRPLPGMAANDRIIVVGIRSLHLAGILLALFFLVFLYFLLRNGAFQPWKTRLLLALLAALGLALVWLPASARLALILPLTALGGCLALVYLAFLLRHPSAPASSGLSTVRRPRLIGLLIVLVLGSLIGSRWVSGQPAMGPPRDEPFPVFLIESTPGKETALVSPALLKKLDELEARARPRTVRALVLAARYQGRWHEGQLEVKAAYEVHSDADRAVLSLPLNGVDLKEGTLLDGAPAFPVAASSGKGGFQIPITGKGTHRLEIPFTVRLSPLADGRQLRFSIPRLARNRVEFHFPTLLGTPFLVSCLGEESLQLGPGKDMQLLRAQLGREGTVQIRFPLDMVPSATPSAEVREMYFWDLRPLTHQVTGVLQYTMAKGTLGKIEIGLPEGTEVRSVDVFTYPGGSGTAPLPALRRWFLTGKEPRRVLHIEPTSPLGGKFQVNLSLVPPAPAAGGTLPLRLPGPMNVKETESFLAYRLEGAEAREAPQNVTYTILKADQFIRAWKAAGQRETEAMIARALTFRRSGIPAAPSGVNLTLSPLSAQGHQEVHWMIHGGHTDLTATFNAASQDEISLIEWHVPAAILVSGVQGSLVHHWSREKDILQVWFQQPVKKATLQLTGWKKNEKPAIGAKPGQVHLPTPICPAFKMDTRVRVSAAPNWAPEPATVKGLKPLSKVPGLPGAWYHAADGRGEGTFKVLPRSINPLTRARTEISLEENQWQVQVSGQWHAPRPGPIRLRLNPGPDEPEEPVLEPGPGLSATYHREKASHVWVLTPKPDAPQPWSFQARYALPLTDALTIQVPQPLYDGEKPGEHTLVLHGPELSLDPSVSLPSEKGGLLGTAAASQTWKVPNSLDKPLLARGSRPKTGALSIPLGQHHLHFTNEARWLHQAGFLLLIQRPTELTFRLPSGARLRGAALGGRPASPHPEGRHFLLSVPGPPRPERLLLSWDFPEGEPADRPRLDVPKFPDHPDTLIMTGVALPPSWEAGPARGVLNDPAIHLRTAQALSKQLSSGEGKGGAGDIVTRDFLVGLALKEVRLAEWFLDAWTPEDALPLRAAAQDLHKSLERQLKKHPPESLLPWAEGNPPPLARSWKGTPGAGWQGPLWTWSSEDAELHPELAFRPAWKTRQSQARRHTEFILVALAGLLIFSLLPRCQALMRATWPEQWLALTLLATWAWGFSILGFLLGAASLLGRLVWLLLLLVRWVGRRWHRPVPEPTPD